VDGHHVAFDEVEAERDLLYAFVHAVYTLFRI
jgi:hypothetical protein